MINLFLEKLIFSTYRGEIWINEISLPPIEEDPDDHNPVWAPPQRLQS